MPAFAVQIERIIIWHLYCIRVIHLCSAIRHNEMTENYTVILCMAMEMRRNIQLLLWSIYQNHCAYWKCNFPLILSASGMIGMEQQ